MSKFLQIYQIINQTDKTLEGQVGCPPRHTPLIILQVASGRFSHCQCQFLITESLTSYITAVFQLTLAHYMYITLDKNTIPVKCYMKQK